MDIKNLKPYIAKNINNTVVAGFIDEKGKTFKAVMTIDSDSDIDTFLDKYNLSVVCMGKLADDLRILEK